jgi:hypothetical protein
MLQPNRHRNASYWLRLKEDESRLAHYRVRRARNQRARRSRPSDIISSCTAAQPPRSDADLLALLIEGLTRAESRE